MDAWDRALDWGGAHPKEAVAFLMSQGIKGELGNRSTDVLRCVGFTRLYETGRVQAPMLGYGGGGAQDALFISVTHLNKMVKALKVRTNILEKKNGLFKSAGGQIVVEFILGRKKLTLDLEPCDTILGVKGKIQAKEGVIFFLIFGVV